MYLIFGVMTTAISIAVFGIFNVGVGFNEHVANVISWLLSVLFAFVTNKLWVFEDKTSDLVELLKQTLSFYAGRLATFLVEELIIFVFATCIGINSMLIKIIASIVVIILNYVISKLFIFKN